MCFSATASFALAGTLTAVGVASIARNSSTPYRLVAATPLIFAAQQYAEGIVWLTISDPAYAALHRAAVITFLGLALIVWPTWLPFALRRAEQSASRRRVLTALFWFGCLVAISAALLLARQQPVAVVAGHRIRYDRAGTGTAWQDLLVLVTYVAPTIVPFFVSTTSLARPMGALLAVSLVATAIIEHDTTTSVWCFFAAMLSCLILVAVGREQVSIPAVRARYLAPAQR